MVNTLEGPIQLLPPFEKVGITVIVATIGLEVLLTGVKTGIFPDPEALRPIPKVSFVHVYDVVPIVFELVNGIAVDAAPAQNTTLFGWLTCPVGFTVIVIVLGVPVQLTPPFSKVGVTVIVVLIGALVLLTAVKTGRFPLPGVVNPTVVLLLVHV